MMAEVRSRKSDHPVLRMVMSICSEDEGKSEGGGICVKSIFEGQAGANSYFSRRRRDSNMACTAIVILSGARLLAGAVV